jgi:hypothetical protein
MGGRHTPTPEEYEKLRKKRERKRGWYNRLELRKPAGVKAGSADNRVEDEIDAPWQHGRCPFCGAQYGARVNKPGESAGDMIDAPCIWTCPFGCDMGAALCIYCFPERPALVIDAATAAWCAGHHEAAAKLLKDYRAPRAPKTPRHERHERHERDEDAT